MFHILVDFLDNGTVRNHRIFHCDNLKYTSQNTVKKLFTDILFSFVKTNFFINSGMKLLANMSDIMLAKAK